MALGALDPTEDKLVPERLMGGGPVENWLVAKSDAGSKLGVFEWNFKSS